jgi:hypothetical protein
VRGSAFSVASAGDVNGDGYSDVIVGAYRLFDNGQTDEGRAFVYHGSASGLSTTPNWTAESNQASAQSSAFQWHRRAMSMAMGTVMSSSGHMGLHNGEAE